MSVNSERKKINKQRIRENKSRIINQDIIKVSIFFVALAFAMMIYLGWFLTFKSETIINNTYNKRSAEFKKTVLRGTIYSSDGEVLAYSENIDGVEQRIYPFDNMYAHVVGFEENGGLGLESSYNYSLLTSSTGFIDKITNEFNSAKNPGDSIYTTLKSDLQQYIYNQIWFKGGAVAINPDTCEIYALVSKPDFNPNHIAENWDSIISDTENSPLVNRVTQGAYTPGSTFKLFTLLEYFRENPQFNEYAYECDGTIENEAGSLSCYDGTVHGYENLKDSFANSCNCSFANIGLTLDKKAFRQNNDKLLFNTDYSLDIPFNKAKFSIDENSSDFMIMQTAMGQGETVTNPMHLALVMSAIANDGVLMRPHLVTQTVNDHNKIIKTYKNEAYKTIFSVEESKLLKEYLRAVVEQGTANTLNWGNYTAYGKTGTAETNSDKELNYDHSWFVGYAENGEEKLVVCVIIENMDETGFSAVDVTKNIFDYYFN